jgi:hypothetical protein
LTNSKILPSLALPYFLLQNWNCAQNKLTVFAKRVLFNSSQSYLTFVRTPLREEGVTTNTLAISSFGSSMKHSKLTKCRNLVEKQPLYKSNSWQKGPAPLLFQSKLNNRYYNESQIKENLDIFLEKSLVGNNTFITTNYLVWATPKGTILFELFLQVILERFCLVVHGRIIEIVVFT